ncbi:hypothetical protein [Streptomyces sp. NPDC058755]|uniref:hypothetical protein n=1 Tax=Streptomyces sp. NPDC058755 TaxID=3346624 RepID=UPI0036A494EC
MEVTEERSDAPDTPDAPDASVVPDAPAPSRPRRRGRTPRLIGAAALLGMVAGACAGYLVQADREPTKLPSLSQPVIEQAKGEVEPLSAAQDRKVRTDGDLRKLLLAKPRGARELDWVPKDGWMDLAAYADEYTDPGDKFSSLVTDQFRRAAVVGWKVGTAYTVQIRLVQYRQEDSMAASDATHNLQDDAESARPTDSWSIRGTGDGRAYVDNRAPFYSAEAHAWRGDIAMEIWIYGTKPIAKKTITGLAERQMERL